MALFHRALPSAVIPAVPSVPATRTQQLCRVLQTHNMVLPGRGAAIPAVGRMIGCLGRVFNLDLLIFSTFVVTSSSLPFPPLESESLLADLVQCDSSGFAEFCRPVASRMLSADQTARSSRTGRGIVVRVGAADHGARPSSLRFRVLLHARDGEVSSRSLG